MSSSNGSEVKTPDQQGWQRWQAQLQRWWLGLQSRERVMLTVGGLLIAGMLFYVGLWQPWRLALAHMEEVLPIKRQELVWMRQQADVLISGDRAPRAVRQVEGEGQSLMAVLEQSARANGVREAIQQLIPRQESGEVSVVLEGVSFNRWVRWIDQLENRYSVNISQLSAERDSDNPDIAEIRVTFSRN